MVLLHATESIDGIDMWFASDNCYLTKNLNDAKEFVMIEEFKTLIKKLYYSYTT